MRDGDAAALDLLRRPPHGCVSPHFFLGGILMSLSLCSFTQWLKKLATLVRRPGRRANRRNCRKPTIRDRARPSQRLEVSALESRESFGNVAVGALIAAGAGGAAAVLFQSAWMRVWDSNAITKVDHNLVPQGGAAAAPPTALPETVGAASLGAFRTVASWSVGESTQEPVSEQRINDIDAFHAARAAEHPADESFQQRSDALRQNLDSLFGTNNQDQAEGESIGRPLGEVGSNSGGESAGGGYAGSLANNLSIGNPGATGGLPSLQPNSDDAASLANMLPRPAETSGNATSLPTESSQPLIPPVTFQLVPGANGAANQFVYQGKDYDMVLSSQGATFLLKDATNPIPQAPHAVSMQFVGANSQALPVGFDHVPGTPRACYVH